MISRWTPRSPENPEQVTLDTRYYDRGICARRRANIELTTVGDSLDEIMGRAERLLFQLAEIVEPPPDNPPNPS